MKHTKRIILICFLFVFLCAQANAQEDMLTIYIPQDDIMTCQSLEIGVQLMKKSYPNLPIQVEYLPGTNYDGEYTKRLTTELMAGGGPDIIVMSDMTFPDINKAVQSNLFADLSSFLLDDHEFDRSNYIIPALDSGVIGNSQIYIPIFLRIPCLVTTEEILSSLGLPNPQHTSMNLSEILHSLANTDATHYLSDIYASLVALPGASGIRFIDYERMSSNLSSEQTREFFEICSQIYQHDYRKPEGVMYSSTIDIFNSLSNGNCVYGLESYSFSTVLVNISLLSAAQTPIAIGLPTIEGGIHASPALALAINANSKSKEAAYAFIKTMLSKEVQYPSIKDSIDYVPVRSVEWRDTVKRSAEMTTENGLGGTDLPVGELPDDLLNYLYEIPSLVTDCGFINYRVLEMYIQSMQPYYDGVKTIDEAMRELQFKLELYISE